MPASIARFTGSVKACRSTSEMAIASALAATAVLKELTISEATDVCEPVHCQVQLNRSHASAMPYCVGTKNGLVVTWFTKTNFHGWWLGNLAAVAACADVMPMPLSAASDSAAAPEPKSRLRRETGRRPVIVDSRSWSFLSDMIGAPSLKCRMARAATGQRGCVAPCRATTKTVFAGPMADELGRAVEVGNGRRRDVSPQWRRQAKQVRGFAGERVQEFMLRTGTCNLLNMSKISCLGKALVSRERQVMGARTPSGSSRDGGYP